MYQGASEERGGWAATVYPVQKLLKNENYHNKNHILATDNWYTSLEVARICIKRGILFVGTIKVNRKGIPSNGIFPSKGKQRQRGEMVSLQIPSGEPIYFTAWQDNKPVHMLHTFPTQKRDCLRKVNDPQRGWLKKPVPQPTVINLYNHSMGGTDLMDQRTSYYGFHHSSVKWPHRIFSHFLMVSVVNAFILFKQTFKSSIRLIDYMKNVLAQIRHHVQLGDESFDNYWNHFNEDVWDSDEDNEDFTVPPIERRKSFRTSDWNELWRERLDKTCFHCPCEVPSKNPDQRRSCVFCRNKSSKYCVSCGAFLCLGPVPEDSCWWKFHHQKKI
jgi:hypothetical protein